MRNEIIAGNEDTRLLKIIAGVCMIVDHVGSRIFTGVLELRIIGRIAFPLYVWCLVVGACHTRNGYRYALRLLLAGIVSQPFYMVGLAHPWSKICVFGPLLLGYLAILGIREKKYGSQYWAPLAALLVTQFVNMDYGMNGVLLIILLYLARENRGAILAVMVSFCLYWGSGGANLRSFCGIPLQDGVFSLPIVRAFMHQQTMALLSLPLMLWPRKTRLRWPSGLAAYAIYPGHLLILWIVQLLMGLTTLEKSLKLLIPWM